MVKNQTGNAEDTRAFASISGSGQSLEWEVAVIPIFLPGKFHGQRSLEGYSPQGRKESDSTEHTQSLNRFIVSPEDCYSVFCLGKSMHFVQVKDIECYCILE